MNEPTPPVMYPVTAQPITEAPPGQAPAPNAPPPPAPTLPALLRRRVALTPQRPAYRAFDADAGAWQTLSWAQAAARVARCHAALAASRVLHGERVAILLPNGLDAMSIDQGTLAQGAVPVPLHAIDNPASIAYILGDCEAALLVVQQHSQWEAIARLGVSLPALRRVVVVSEPPLTDEPTEGSPAPQAPPTAPAGSVLVQQWAAWLDGGQAATPQSLGPGPVADDLAAIVYTSGTTGKPKGVMLTHRNVVANVQACEARVRPREDDLFLSFLPLSHTFERTAGYYLPIAAGSCVAYARSVAQLSEDLLSQRPTVLVSVPRIYERVYGKLQEALSPSPFKAWLMALTQQLGWRRFRAAQQLPPDDAGAPEALDALLWPLLSAFVAQPVLARFGGRVRVAVSGGAALPPVIARAFIGLGLPLLQGYGMTETSPVAAVNGLDDNDPASVGRALAGVQLRIGENRELQIKADSVMKGYWKRPEDTAKVLSADGWLSTGDQAELLNGRVYIRGRLKEIIVTSTGEKVPPADLEQAICADALFEQVFIVGENQPFIGAVVVLQRAEWQRLAEGLKLDPADAASLSAPAAREAVLNRLRRQTTGFPRYAMPRAVVLSLTPWTVDNALLTPTLKLKRQNLLRHFEAELAAMYGAARPVG